jgi:hypothetical protein
MYGRITVERNIDELTKEMFDFYLTDDLHFYIDRYELAQKESARQRKYSKIVKIYNRLEYNKRNFTGDQWIIEKDIPITEDIIEQAYNQIISKVEFGYWKDDRK